MTGGRIFIAIIVSLVVLLLRGTFVSSLKYEGDHCRVTTFDDQPPVFGVCRSARKCPQAFRNPSNRNPDLCMFTRNDAIICCPVVEASALTLDIHPVIVDDDERVEKKIQPPRISQLKCSEYGKLTQRISPVVPLIPDPIFFEVSTTKCDRITPLIVNGEKTRNGEFPHMAAIGYRIPMDEEEGDDDKFTLKFICGGVLISSQFVLTAAHCTNVYGDKPSVVRLGGQKVVKDGNLFRQDDDDVPIAEVIAHPLYKRTLYYHDIGLLRLARRVRFNDFVRPACLWYDEEIDAKEAIATGWGVTKFGGEKSEDLLKVTLNLFPFDECKRLYGRHKRIPKGILSSQLCAGNGRQDTCQGDSGGPIQIMAKGNSCLFYIVGITSFGKSCAANSPGVYTKVFSYLDWIEEIVWPNTV